MERRTAAVIREMRGAPASVAAHRTLRLIELAAGLRAGPASKSPAPFIRWRRRDTVEYHARA
jgi:hypothetical protein